MPPGASPRAIWEVYQVQTEKGINKLEKDYAAYTHYKDVLSLQTLASIVQQVDNHAAAEEKGRLKVLDLGCGIGGVAFPLACLGHQVVGVDVDKPTIEFCRKNNRFENASFLVASGNDFDLEDKFDVVICCGVLEHVPRPDRMLETVRKHMKPGGIAIINIPNGHSLYEIVFSRLCTKLRITRLFHKLPNSVYRMLTGSDTPYHSLNIFCDHINFFSYGGFSEMLRNHGFRPVETVNLGMGIFLDWKFLRPLKKLECRLAPLVPRRMAGSWNFVVK